MSLMNWLKWLFSDITTDETSGLSHMTIKKTPTIEFTKDFRKTKISGEKTELIFLVCGLAEKYKFSQIYLDAEKHEPPHPEDIYIYMSFWNKNYLIRLYFSEKTTEFITEIQIYKVKKFSIKRDELEIHVPIGQSYTKIGKSFRNRTFFSKRYETLRGLEHILKYITDYVNIDNDFVKEYYEASKKLIKQR